MSQSITSSNSSYIYAQSFVNMDNAGTATSYNQTLAFNLSGNSSIGLIGGDAVGNGSTLTFTATRTGSATWGSLAIPLIPISGTTTTLTSSGANVAVIGTAPKLEAELKTSGGASVTVTGTAPSLVTTTVLAPSPATITVTGTAPSLFTTTILSPIAATIAITGSAPSLITASNGAAVEVMPVPNSVYPITLDAAGTATATGYAANGASWTHTVSGNFIVVAVNGVLMNNTGMYATVGGVAMTKLVDSYYTGLRGGSYGFISFWYLANPPQGSQTIAVAAPQSLTSGTFWCGNSYSYNNVGSVTAATVATSTTTTSASVTLNGSVGQVALNLMGGWPGSGNFTNYNQTARYNGPPGGGPYICLIGEAPGATSVTFSATSPTVGYGWGAMAAGLNLVARTIATIVTPAPAVITVTGEAAALTIITAPPRDTITVTSGAPSLTRDISPAAATTITITGRAPLVAITSILSPDAAAITVTGTPPLLLTSLKPAADVIAITSSAPSLVTISVLAPAAAAITVIGKAPRLDIIVVPPGSSLTGALITLTGAVPVLATTLVTTGVTITVTGGTPATGGVIYVAPTAATITVAAGTSMLAVSMVPAAPVLRITGTAPKLITVSVLTPAAAAIIITGTTPSLLDRIVPAGALIVVNGAGDQFPYKFPFIFDSTKAPILKITNRFGSLPLVLSFIFGDGTQTGKLPYEIPFILDNTGAFSYELPFFLGPVYSARSATEAVVSFSNQFRLNTNAAALLPLSANSSPGARLAALSGTDITAITALPDALVRRLTVALAQPLAIVALADSRGRTDGLAETATLSVLALADSRGRTDGLGAANLDVLAICVPQGKLFVFADASLAALATPGATGAFLHWGNAELFATANALTAARLSARANAPLAVVALAQLALINRHAGGNPMWLTFFYAGQGQRTL